MLHPSEPSERARKAWILACLCAVIGVILIEHTPGPKILLAIAGGAHLIVAAGFVCRGFVLLSPRRKEP